MRFKLIRGLRIHYVIGLASDLAWLQSGEKKKDLNRNKVRQGCPLMPRTRIRPASEHLDVYVLCALFTLLSWCQ